jgi:adenine/guanine phosphoribosyltransferase-like PRPP-binding protein
MPTGLTKNFPKSYTTTRKRVSTKSKPAAPLLKPTPKAAARKWTVSKDEKVNLVSDLTKTGETAVQTLAAASKTITKKAVRAVTIADRAQSAGLSSAAATAIAVVLAKG